MDESLHKWYWLPPNWSTHGDAIDRMMVFIHWFMVVLFVAWGIFFVYCLFRFRARPGHKATYELPKGTISRYAEIGIVIIEVVLLVGFSMPIWARVKNQFPKEEDATVVRVVGEQFAWNFHYPGKDGKFGATRPDLISAGDNPLGLDLEDPAAKDDFSTLNVFHFPVNKPVIARLTTKDVIHSFGVHMLRVKQDVIPGMEIPIWFQATTTGETELACSQLCGLGHYRMRAGITIDTPEQYEAFLAENAPAPEEPAPEEPAPGDAATEGGTK